MSFWKKNNTKATAPIKATPTDYEKAFNAASEEVSLISPSVEVLNHRVSQDELRIDNLTDAGAETRHLARTLREIPNDTINDTLHGLRDSVDDFRAALDDEADPADMLDVKNAIRRINATIHNLLDKVADANSRLDELEDSLIRMEHGIMTQSADISKISLEEEEKPHEAESTPEEQSESAMSERQRYWSNFFKSLTSPTADIKRQLQPQPAAQEPQYQPDPISLDVMFECCYQKWCTAGKDFDALTIEDRIVKPWIKETRRRNSGTVVDIYEAKTPDDLDDAVYGWLEGDEIIPAPEGEELDFIRYVYETELENVS